MYGWAGKILRVNLDNGSITTEDTSKYVKYTGGIGFGYKVIFDEAPTADPFSPENRIVFAVGPLTGSLAPSSGRSEVISISPHVYAPGSKRPLVTRSGFGGYWGAELKFAGYDAIVVHGRARKPVFINVHNETVTLEDAQPMWGKDTFETQDMIKAMVGDEKVQIAVIGPSGENLVRISPIIHRIGNAAGQGGFGAVMGSKNLKAIAVRGTNGVQVADKKNLIEYVRSVREFQPGPLGSTPLSTGPLSWTEKHVDPKDINKQAPRFDQTESCAPWLNKYHVKAQSCYSCPQGCYSYMNVDGMGGGAVSCTQWFYSWMGNRDLSREVGKGRFHEALYHRLNVFLINIPSLRDHKEDIPMLVEHFLEQLYPDRPPYRVSKRTAQSMIAYDWPGNVRELRNVIERGIILAENDLITTKCLPSDIVNSLGDGSTCVPLPTLAQHEKQYILRVMEHAEHNRTLAARILGIGRKTFYRKLQTFGRA
jgi:hypothetical protein